MTTTDTRPLKDVLYEFSLAKYLPDSALVEDFVQRYPEHASALTEFAVQVVLDALAGSDTDAVRPTTQDHTPEVSAAMSRFQNRLYIEQQKHERSAPAENPFESLDRSALRGLAQELRANTVFVMKLRDRQITATTISPGFFQAVARSLAVSTELLTAHFNAPPQMQAAARFKAGAKPSAGDKQTFEQAVRSSGLDLDQQDYLLSL